MKKVFFVITTLCIVIACSKTTTSDPGEPINCNETTKSFAADVNPVIQMSCASNSGCHNAGSTNGPGELLRYSQVFNARIAIRAAIISGRMPQTGSLSTAQKNSIICWIDNGAPDN